MESIEITLGQVAGWYSMMSLHPQRRKGRPLTEEVSGHPTGSEAEDVSRAGGRFQVSREIQKEGLKVEQDMRLDGVSSRMGQRRTGKRRETCIYFPPSSDR